MRRTRRALLVLPIALFLPFSSAQTHAADPELKFEVVSLKTNQTGGPGGIRPAPGGERYIATNVPLRLLITLAYRIKTDQISGGPSWIDTDRYDMNAKAERASTIEELHVMLQNMLAERFKLQIHRGSKEMSMYALTVDKGGPKLTPHQAQSAGDPWIEQAQAKPFHMQMTAKFVPMDYFAWRLGQLLDRPVINRTDLKGGYDFVLSYTRDLPPDIPEGASLNGEPIDTSGPRIFEALRQQLGLRLDAQKGPVETIVIDHAEKPTEN